MATWNNPGAREALELSLAFLYLALGELSTVETLAWSMRVTTGSGDMDSGLGVLHIKMGSLTKLFIISRNQPWQGHLCPESKHPKG